ncbi:hypothetical protein EUX98_g1104 [Antrodiella citrinella]|uniref:FAD-binding PCMH-type domain-containing protein n=1 Tax=Antrodiella citrinella TaxID=2447956 RepID=A0A4S4N294_9APHY|nr:hypothetical protein EUX98_g1104 [Antrodiella citrinella]
MSSSEVFFPSDTTGHYANDTFHWSSASSQNSTCSVEPGTPQDVATILKILGATKVPFAVKGGGHTTNPGFSSTPGVQIAMTRFNAITYNADEHIAELGAGLVWDEVYATLNPLGVNVVGERVTGVGVAGYLLGAGGYSYLSNQYGLGVDNVEAYDLVLPSGEFKTITKADMDLYFAIIGGFNNFGIVTKFTVKTHPQDLQVWGGTISLLGDTVDQLNAATVNFMNNVTDPKAAMLPSLSSWGLES